MKQILAIIAFVLVGAVAAKAQTTGGPVMSFDTVTIDYGIIEKGSDPIRKFKFTNTGNEPLIIKAAQGSCGCTVPTYPLEPIMPGESDYISVRYDTQRMGGFIKYVTLTTNGKYRDTHTLTIKGEVKAPATQEPLPASSGGLNHN